MVPASQRLSACQHFSVSAFGLVLSAFDLLITEPKRPKLWADPFWLEAIHHSSFNLLHSPDEDGFGLAATGFRRSLIAKSLWYRDIRVN
jgi:hypothetical protein